MVTLYIFIGYLVFTFAVEIPVWHSASLEEVWELLLRLPVLLFPLGGGGLSPSPCRLLQTEGAGPVVVTGQELQGPCACRAVSQAADGRSQGGLRHYPAAQHPRGACISIPRSAQ